MAISWSQLLVCQFISGGPVIQGSCVHGQQFIPRIRTGASPLPAVKRLNSCCISRDIARRSLLLKFRRRWATVDYHDISAQCSVPLQTCCSQLRLLKDMLAFAIYIVAMRGKYSHASDSHESLNNLFRLSRHTTASSHAASD